MTVSDAHTLVGWVQDALAGMASPLVIAAALALTTFLLEDVAIAAGSGLATAGVISWTAALIAVGGGIAVGDVGLYGLGAAARRIPWLKRRAVGQRSAWAYTQLVQRLASAVMLARVIPGLRLVTYTACGFLEVPLLAFSAWVIVAVLIWTVGLFALSVAVGRELSAHLGVSPPIAAALPVLLIAALVPVARALARRRRAGTPA